MPTPTDQVKDALLEAAIELTKERYTRLPPAEVDRLMRLHYDRVAPQDLEGKDPIDLYGAAVRHWHLAEQRPAGETIVRVYNPDINDDGWTCTHTAIDVVSDDMPFIVDSLLALLEVQGRHVHVLVHPMLSVERDDDGGIVGMGDPVEERPGTTESFVHIEIDRLAEEEELRGLHDDVAGVMSDVRAAVDDWQQMRERALELAGELEGWSGEDPPRFVASSGTDPDEAARLLRWMEAGSFTFTGYREYDYVDEPGAERIVSRPDTGLGILRQREASTSRLSDLPTEIADLASRPHPLNLTKANALSTIHRAVPLDYIGIKEIDAHGRVTGERRFVGLFTSTVYSGQVEDIPVVRAKAYEVMARSHFPPGSHDRSRLRNILQTYPRDELFQIHVDQLVELTHDILDLRDRRSVSLLLRRDDYGRFLSCLVFVPRDRHNTDVRLEIQSILMEAYQGRSCRFSTEISDEPLARLHMVIFTDYVAPEDLPELNAVQARLSRVIRTWDDYLRSSLVDAHGEQRGLELLRRYGDAFGPAYRSDVLAETAVIDIAHLEGLDGGGLDISLHRPLDAEPDILRCKLYRADEPITLSRFIPLLHDLGAVVIDEIPYEVEVDDERRRFIYDIGIRLDHELDADGRRRFADAVLAVWRGDAASDGLARLVSSTDLTWRDVSVLRAYSRYLFQLGSTFSPTYVRETVTSSPDVAQLLFELFVARFDPRRHDDADADAKRAELTVAIEAVASLDADRILRSFVSLIDATLRTNYFQTDDDGDPRPALALKLDPSAIPNVPKPVPAVEVFVSCPRTEGVHLRSGRVARGGLRWSDRMEDYRTEILGLMKAQTVKNSVIVPVGAKGGFVARHLPSSGDRDAVMAEVVECYRTFVGGLLDITDNLVDGKAVPPPQTVCHDGDDPYLVVAADKGTATFSDVANAIAEARDFWLGDAFASGGSAGYDHKALGITARGAWVSVQRHFRELDTDIETSTFSAVGIGDMSGDVFGNGLLLSRNVRLLAAFDHRDVFVDPDPDVAASFAERERLFALPRSSWADYDPTLISTGGGVFSRQAKAIDVTPEMSEALGIDPAIATLAPSDLIRAILRAPVDLLWNGGIGTYVKATSETDGDVGDRANDGVRVDATELRCRIVGEGGNLGVTQLGRIEFASQGGRINTDAIDNSAGVDCSDHEVNLKILLAQAERNGDMTRKQRDRLLESMADEVCAQVLANNDAQNDTLSAAQAQAAGMVGVHERLMAWLEEHAHLDRELEALPSDAELETRRATGAGLTRPELAVLLAYTKNLITDELDRSDLPADQSLDRRLLEYFPQSVRDGHADLVLTHPLRDELVATIVANELVNRGGITMVHRLISETSATVADIARAHIAACRIYDLVPVWDTINSLGSTVPADVHTELELAVKRLAERSTRWLLRNESQPIDIDGVVAVYADPVHRLHDIVAAGTAEIPSDEQDAIARLEERGVPAELARRVGASGAAFGFLDLSRVAATTGADLARVAAIATRLDETLDLSWLRQRIVALPRRDHWETLARSALRDQYFHDQAELTAAVLRGSGRDGDRLDVDAAVDGWLEHNGITAERCRQTFAEIEAAGVHDLARVSVAVRALGQLAR